MARWQFYLVNSKDLSPVTELTQARGRSLDLKLNQPGSCSFNYPITDEFAPIIDPIKTGIIAYRNGSAKWSGYINGIDEDISGNRMTVTAVGWLQRLERRVARKELTYTLQDDAEIIYELLGHANGGRAVAAGGVNARTLADGYEARWPMGSVPNVPTWVKEGIKQPNEGFGGATLYAPLTSGPPDQRRSVTITKYAPLLPEIMRLVEVENGVDIHVDPLSRSLDIFRKRQKILDGVAGPSVLFGYRWGPNNIQQLSRQIDGATVANYHLAVGPTAYTTPQYMDGRVLLPADTDQETLYGLLEEVYNLSEVRGSLSDPAAGSRVLLAYATAEWYVKRRPREIYSLVPFPHTASSSVPEPFDDYDLGDRVYFSARQGERIQINKQAVRVFGMNISIDEEGNEKVGQLQFTP